jgi:hypothetical protein
LVGDTPKDAQVNTSQEVRKIFMCLVISNLLRVVDAAIQGSVDCEDYISHLIVLTPSFWSGAFESLRPCAPDRSSYSRRAQKEIDSRGELFLEELATDQTFANFHSSKNLVNVGLSPVFPARMFIEKFRFGQHQRARNSPG